MFQKEMNLEKKFIIFPNYFLKRKRKLTNKIIVDNFIEEIWKKSDEYIINEIISISEKWGRLSKMTINFDDYNKLLDFLYLFNDKILKNKKLLPSVNGNFHI